MVEYYLPFNKRKWAAVLSPTYVSSSGADRHENKIFALDYKAIELPIGVRHNFYVNDNVFFLTASFVGSMNLNTTFAVTQDYFDPEYIDIRSNMNYMFSAGYLFKDRLMFEAKYYTPRDVMNNSYYFYSSYESFAITLGYKLF